MAIRSHSDSIIGRDVSLWVAQRHAKVQRTRRMPIWIVTGGAVLTVAAWSYLHFVQGLGL